MRGQYWARGFRKNFLTNHFVPNVFLRNNSVKNRLKLNSGISCKSRNNVIPYESWWLVFHMRREIRPPWQGQTEPNSSCFVLHPDFVHRKRIHFEFCKFRNDFKSLGPQFRQILSISVYNFVHNRFVSITSINNMETTQPNYRDFQRFSPLKG